MNKDLIILRFEESLFDESTNKITKDLVNLGVDTLLETNLLKKYLL